MKKHVRFCPPWKKSEDKDKCLGEKSLVVVALCTLLGKHMTNVERCLPHSKNPAWNNIALALAKQIISNLILVLGRIIHRTKTFPTDSHKNGDLLNSFYIG